MQVCKVIYREKVVLKIAIKVANLIFKVLFIGQKILIIELKVKKLAY